jgi:hypothetical protein
MLRALPWRGTVPALLLLSLLSDAAFAQTTTGALSGTVTDPAGAAVANTKIEIVNQATGVTAALITNDAGVYKAAFLNPGIYTVRVQAAGFSTLETKDVEVQLNGEPVVNAKLQVGANSQTIEC